jgi:sugar lactone lactonase YvrE
MAQRAETGRTAIAADVAWARLPDGDALGDVAAVGVDDRDRVYAFTRGTHPVIVLDRDGAVLRTWGHGVFTRPHGLHVAPDGHIYCTDDGDHTVRKCTPDGDVVLTIGLPGRPAPFMSGDPFCRCTHSALGPDGDIYVSDGYGNARVHRFAPDGRLRASWGASGSGPGEFYIPHNICCDEQGWVYVADRENHRIQVFDADGRLEDQWHDLHRPCALALAGERVLVGELGPQFRHELPFPPDLGACVALLDRDGAVTGRIGGAHPGPAADQFVAPHGIAMDSEGSIYVAEVAHAMWAAYDDGPPPPDLPTLRKLAPVPA